MLGIGRYDFYFNLTDTNGTTMTINGTPCATGKRPLNETSMLTVPRLGILEDEIAKVRLTVWA